ncbi:hypothetical protein CRYUN_Cryun09bG0146000 [Craigia yunnanensis]
MSSQEEVSSTRVVIGGVSTDQTSSYNYNPLETIISVHDGDLNLSSGDLENLKSFDEALEGDQIEPLPNPTKRSMAEPGPDLRVAPPLMLGGNKDF